jgi:hypothetical protein
MGCRLRRAVSACALSALFFLVSAGSGQARIDLSFVEVGFYDVPSFTDGRQVTDGMTEGALYHPYVRCQWLEASGSNEWLISFYVDRQLMAEIRMNNVGTNGPVVSGSRRTISTKNIAMPAGRHTITAKIDSNRQHAESDEFNNRARRGVRVYAPPEFKRSWSDTLRDIDGDGITDAAVYDPASSTWYLRGSASGQQTIQFGFEPSRQTMADFDGDGKSDLCVIDTDATWYILGSASGLFTRALNDPGYVPVPADYGGDGLADCATYDPRNGFWYVERSSDNDSVVVELGYNGADPMPGDFDGDGKTDYCVYDSYSGWTYAILSTEGFVQHGWLGSRAAGIPVALDFDGNGRDDYCMFDGTYWVASASPLSDQPGHQHVQYLGAVGDIPVPGDYDGDGVDDFAVYSPSSGTWSYWNGSQSVPFSFGWNGVYPPGLRP